MEDKKIIYSREVKNYIWSRLNRDSKEGSWYDISDVATLDISEVWADYDNALKVMRHGWTMIELIEENEIFIHQSCMCYPNATMLFLTVDELENISKNLKIGYTYKNITVNKIVDDLVTLTSDSQEEKIRDGRNSSIITKGLLKMGIAKLKKEKII